MRGLSRRLRISRRGSWTVRAALNLDGTPWELRAATVRPNGTPWVDLDSTGMPEAREEPVTIDWPYPEPGPGMVPDDPADWFSWPGESRDLPNGALFPADVPGPNATWGEIEWFAAHYDGYAHHGQSALAHLANSSAEWFRRGGALGADMTLTGSSSVPLLRAPAPSPLRARTRHRDDGVYPDAGGQAIRQHLEA